MSTEFSFMRMAIDASRKCKGEDGRVHPKVGAVIVKDGKILAVSYRGELADGDHAEFTALEKKLSEDAIAGSTVYTTLEPCTTRNHPKVPCAERLIERKVRRVVIGMLDPNPDITGKGQRRLRAANIETDFFPADLMSEIEELNRDFTRYQERLDEAPSISDEAPEAQATSFPGQHVANVNLMEQNPSKLRVALLENLTGISGVHVTPAATLNFGTGPDRVQKYQYQITFTSLRTISREELSSALAGLEIELNSLHAPGDAA